MLCGSWAECFRFCWIACRSNLPRSMAGGSAQNAIPREAAAVVVTDAAREGELKSLVAAAEAGYKTDLGGFDSGLQITVQKAERPAKVMEAGGAKQTVAFFASLHHGVLAMS